MKYRPLMDLLLKVQPVCLSWYNNSLWAFDCAYCSKSHIERRGMSDSCLSCVFLCVYMCVCVCVCADSGVLMFLCLCLWISRITLTRWLKLWCWGLSVIVSCRYSAGLVPDFLFFFFFFKLQASPRTRLESWTGKIRGMGQRLQRESTAFWLELSP